MITICTDVGQSPPLSVQRPDTAVCRNRTVEIPVTTSANKIEWSDARGNLIYAGPAQRVIAGPFESGDSCYILRAIGAAGCDSLLTICIPLKEPGVMHHDTIRICTGDSAMIHGQWQHLPGLYDQHYTTLHTCDSLSEVVLLNYNVPEIKMELHDPDCMGRPGTAHIMVMNAGGNEQIQWNNSILSGWVQNNLAAGEYEFEIIDRYGCAIEKSFILKDIRPIEISLPQDTAVVEGSPVLITPDVSDCVHCTYSWWPPTGLNCTDCREPTAILFQNTQYILNVQNGYGCTATDSILIRIFKEEDKPDIFIPNIFSPNHDNINDKLEVSLASGTTLISMSVYDRWGGVKYSCEGGGCAWDGRYKGKEVTPGVYIVMVRYKTTQSEEMVKSADVTVVR